MTSEPTAARPTGTLRSFVREAFEAEGPADPRAHRAVRGMVLVFSALFFVLAMLRYDTFHDSTFDLAMYARMVWGETHGSSWEPIVNASVYGLHLVWIFKILGLAARIFGAVPTLLFTQALAVGLAAFPLSRLGARHLGSVGAIVAPLAFLLHPNVAAVASGEFHPGTVAVLPIAWAAEGFDRRSGPLVLLSSIGIVLCREDLGLVAAFVSIGLAIVAHREGALRTRKIALRSAAFAVVYVAVFLFVLHPIFAPAHGSLGLHFGRHGSSVAGVIVGLVTNPAALATHLSTSDRLLYLPIVVAPFALLPFLSPSCFLLAAPVLGVALLSDFPTTTCLDSHYLTPALPLLVRGAVHGALRLPDPRAGAFGILTAAIVTHAVGGATPVSARFDGGAFTNDARSAGMREMCEAVPPLASVQAPDAMLAHLAERMTLHRVPPPERGSDLVVLDLSHRRRFLHREDLLRTAEEPLARAWLARRDHAVIAESGDFVLLERGLTPRESLGVERYVVGTAAETEGRLLTACLALLSATLDDHDLVLELGARDACPDDLALRIGTGTRPRRVDLIADGLFSPAHFLPGDRIRSRHVLSDLELEAIREDGLRIGAIRESGARPAHEDPLALDVPLSL